MKWSTLAALLAYVQISSCFMTQKDYSSRPDLVDCYNKKYGERTGSSRQDYQPLAHSMETFVALVERLEGSRSVRSAEDIVRKLLASYRVDGLANWGKTAKALNDFKKAMFGITSQNTEPQYREELSEPERCSIHFMLSHGVNFTATIGAFEEEDENKMLKHPREGGVVSLQGKWTHAIVLDRVLLGILAGLNTKIVDSSEICRQMGCTLTGVKINPLFSATIGDLISIFMDSHSDKNTIEEATQGNGKWNDLSCPTEYVLNENKGSKLYYLTNAMFRGAVDGLAIGYKISKNQAFFRNIPLSQILRMYYGPTGLVDESEAKSGSRVETQWCYRDRVLPSIGEVKEEVLNFYKIYADSFESAVTEDSANKLENALNNLKLSNIDNEVKDESDSCSISETAAEKCTTPYDIFAILDWQTSEQQRNFQLEVIGNLSSSFDVRPRGSSVGVFRNARYGATGLEVMANNSEGSACSSCFIRYNTRMPTKIGEVEVFEKLNQTLTSFEEAYENAQNSEGDGNKGGAPAKIILYFNYASPAKDYKIGEAVWEIEKNFQETTVLAVGSKKEALSQFTQNDDLDIFTESSNAASFATKLKERLCKAPAEFQYRGCQIRSQFSSGDSSQEAVIGMNKKQYWAMYPKYFLKSFGIVMKFIPQEGAKIKVCFTRAYYRLIEGNAQYMDCKESTGDEITYYVSNPCHRRSLHSCDPFYFLVEGKQTSPSLCSSPRCSTPKDIVFEFQHEGISCNTASFLSVSMLTLLFAGLLIILQRH